MKVVRKYALLVELDNGQIHNVSATQGELKKACDKILSIQNRKSLLIESQRVEGMEIKNRS